MENITESVEKELNAQFMHTILKSKKYKISYEVFWSEKFLCEIKKLNNRHLTNMLKQIKSEKLEEDKSENITRDWLIIKEISKTKSEGELKEMWLQLSKQLFENIETDAIVKGFESQLNLEENKMDCDQNISPALVTESEMPREI